MHCVNAVPYVCAAAPGLRTYLDLPLVAGRAAPHLHRGPGRAMTILDRFAVTDRVAIVTGAGLGHRPGHRHRPRRSGRRRRAGRPHRGRPRRGGRRRCRARGRRALVVPTDVTDEQALRAPRRGDASSTSGASTCWSTTPAERCRAPRWTPARASWPAPSSSTSPRPLTLTKLAARQMVDTVGSRRGGQHLVPRREHDPDDVRGLRRGQGGPRPDDAEHRRRAGATRARQRHRRRWRRHRGRSTWC